MNKKISIKQVLNGFIVKIKNSGQSALTEPYEKDVLIFKSHTELKTWLAKFFDYE